MTAPTPPPVVTPPLPPALTLSSLIDARAQQLHVRYQLVLAGLVVVGALVGLFSCHEVRKYGAVAATEARKAAEAARASAAEHTAAVRWQAVATAQRANVKRDTVHTQQVVEGAPHYFYTSTGMQEEVKAPMRAPPAPALDTTSPGHKPLGWSVPYTGSIPPAAWFVRATDFDSLARSCARERADFQAAIAAQDSAAAHAGKSCADQGKELAATKRELTAAERRSRWDAIKWVFIGVGAGVIASKVH